MTDVKYAPGKEFFQNLKDGPQRFPALYHFPGTGPEGETCGSCANFLPSSNKERGRCKKWIEHRGGADRLEAREEGEGNWWRGLPTIFSDTDSCKYWDKLPEGEK